MIKLPAQKFQFLKCRYPYIQLKRSLFRVPGQCLPHNCLFLWRTEVVEGHDRVICEIRAQHGCYQGDDVKKHPQYLPY